MYGQDREPASRSGFKLDSKTIIIGLVLLVAAVFFVPRLLGSNNDYNEDTGNGAYQEPDGSQPDQPVNPGDEQLNTGTSLGAIVSASAVDRDNCPVEQTTTFSPSDEIYVVAQNSNVTTGTSVFVRLYRDGELVEDAPEITAAEDYENSCIAFVFEPANAGGFEPGTYEALFVVNGNEAESVQFQVQ